MQHGPLVSVIMPLYNKRPYAARSIKSILEQTYRDWELVIVDDGSTDGSADELAPFLDGKRIRLMRQANQGPSAARNKAAAMASGQYLAFIDADDCYYPFKLEKEVEFLWGGRNAEWMMSAYDHQRGGKITRHFMKDINGAGIESGCRVFEDALRQLTVSGWPSDGLFMKRPLFERLSGFNEQMRYGEISELVLRCAAAQPRVGICGTPLYRLIDVPDSTAKVTNRDDSLLQIGNSLHRLAEKYPQYAGFLDGLSRNNLVSYAVSLALEGRGKEARRFLFREFPLAKDGRWLKVWAASWLPPGLIARLTAPGKERRQAR